MVEMLLPPAVVSASTRVDVAGAALFEAEAQALGNPVPERRSEFVTTRWCAHRALGRLGLPDTPVPSGEAGEPVWPAGVVGSITHCEDYRACAVAHERDVRSIGIDAEPDAPLPDGVLATIAVPADRGAPEGVNWDRLLFSAKEAVFKAWFPVTRRPLGFEDVAVQLGRSTFTARVLAADPRIGELRGRWAVEGNIICTAVVVPW